MDALKSPHNKAVGPTIGLQLQNKFYSGTGSHNILQHPHNTDIFDRKPFPEPKFNNVKLNFAHKRELSYVPNIKTSKELFSPKKSSSDIMMKNSVINRNAIKKASFPSYIGMTPEYENITLKSTMPSMTPQNIATNKSAKLKLNNTTGNFKFEMPRNLKSPVAGGNIFKNSKGALD